MEDGGAVGTAPLSIGWEASRCRDGQACRVVEWVRTGCRPCAQCNPDAEVLSVDGPANYVVLLCVGCVCGAGTRGLTTDRARLDRVASALPRRGE